MTGRGKCLALGSVAMVLAAGQVDAQGRWEQIRNKPNCVIRNADPKPRETVTWSGACVNGRADGFGTQVWRYFEDGRWREQSSTGTISNGHNTGRGVVLYPNGNRYEGDSFDGYHNGQGVMSYRNGNRYEGAWRWGKAHGFGTLVLASGIRLQGNWVNGCLRKGTRTAAVGASRADCGFD